MSEGQTYQPGAFCWADLATTDYPAAKEFYSKLFGWQCTEVPTGETSVYGMFSKGENRICALYPMAEAMQAQDVPPFWQSYIATDDVDQSSNLALALDGTQVAAPFDVLDSGRMAIVRDPTGAVFALWQARKHHGADIMGQSGTLCWFELYTRDMVEAENFYHDLFGWKTEKTTGTMDQAYTQFMLDGRPLAGMMEIKPEWGKVPANWSIYFAVEDCDETLANGEAMAAKRIMDPMNIPGVGRFVAMQDPQGAYFSIIALQTS